MIQLDDLISQFAFGKKTRLGEPCLGLYIATDAIELAQTHVAPDGTVVVDQCVRVPMPAPAATAQNQSALNLESDLLTQSDSLKPLIQQALSQIPLKTKNVMVTLSHHFGFLRYFTLPSIDRRFWSSAIPLEAKKHVPLPLETLSYDFQVRAVAAQQGQGKPRMAALMAVTPKKNPGPLNALLKSLGLNLLGLEVAPCSFSRFLGALDPAAREKTFCQAHFDGGQIRLLVIEKGLPVFVREIFLESANPNSDRRRIDLSGGIAFAQKQFEVGALNFVRLSGQGSDLAAWQQTFAQELPLAPAVQDLKIQLKLNDAGWSTCAAVGASLRFLVPSNIALDLGSENKVVPEEIRAAKFLMAVFAAAALWYVGLGLLNATRCWSLEAGLRRTRRDPSVEAVFANKSPAEIDAMMRALQDQLDMVRSSGFDESRTTELLKDVADTLPDKVWLTDISLTRPIPVGESPPKLELDGHAEGDAPREEEDLVFEYKNKLAKSPAAGKLFQSIQVSVSHKATQSAANQGFEAAPATADAGSGPPEERTSFVLTAQ